MAQLQALGWVMTDPELKVSAKGNPYVRFTVVERIGKRDSGRQQYIQVWAFGELTDQLKKAGVKKNSYLWVSGSLELADCVKSDGITHDKQLKLTLKDWEFALPHSGKQQREPVRAPASDQVALGQAGVIYGDRENLPE